MKSKRMLLFALFTCVFALYGCVSSVSDHVEIQSKAVNIKENTSINVSNTQLSQSLQESKPKGELLAVLDGSYQASYQIRNLKGELKVRNAFQQVAKKYDRKIKETREKKAASVAVAKKKKEEEARTFSGKITTYGVDCFGCTNIKGRGGTAMGVALDMNMGVEQPDGSFQPGIRYGQYYVIAADPSVPMCSILKISNHGLQGSGITADKPFYAIVLDRGGAIFGGHVDLYVGSENSSAVSKIQSVVPSIQIIRVGGQQGGTCAI